MLIPRRWATVNDVTTGETPAYPEIVPHRYAETPDRVYAAAQEAISGMARWKIVREDPGAKRIEAEIRTFLLGFTDDVTVWIVQDGAGSRVMIRSHSRVGRGDLGENARTLRALQREIDRQLLP